MVLSAATLFCEEERRRMDEAESKVWERCVGEGMQVNDLTPEEIAVFVERTQPVYDESRQLLGDEVFELALEVTRSK